jgi:hypothetical protein
MSNDLRDEIEAAATTPQNVASDGTQVANRSIAEMIAADKYLKQQQAAAQGGLGIGIQVIRPSGRIQ